MSLKAGSVGISRGGLAVLVLGVEGGGEWYSRIPAVVVLSKVAGPVA